MKYEVFVSNRFKKDFKRCQKRGLDMKLIMEAMSILEENGALPPKYRPHKLSANREGQWECHIEPDFLLIYKVYEDVLTLMLFRAGSHSDLF